VIDALYQQLEWADATTWRAIVATPEAETDATIRDRMLHVHSVQHAYLFLWLGAEPVIPGSSHFANLEAIREWGREFHRLVKPVLQELDPAKLDQPFAIPWAKRFEKDLGRSFSGVTLRETLLQIPMHSHYHRGQVNTRLRELGATPPLVDFIAWAWFGKPGAEWP
jgi:uncharacterized damage-inducible protein DinB